MWDLSGRLDIPDACDALAFFGLTLLSIGIIGIYLMNILNEAKKMPHYVIRQEETD